MAVTTTASIQAQVPQLWAEDLQSQAEFSTFWGNFEGDVGSAMPIQRRDDLTKEDGDTIKFDLTLALTGSGVTGDTVLLEGNEEALKFRQQSLTVEALTHGVRWTKKAAVLNTHALRPVALNRLARWLSGQYDNRVFAEFTGETVGGYAGSTTIPTANKWFAGSASTVATVGATGPATPGAASGGTLTLRDITELKAYAQVNPKIEPLMDNNGNEYFGLCLHPYAALALKRDDTQWAQAQRDAQMRGADNPIFTGALGVWDGVILYSNARVPVLNDGASSNPVARNIFFGANALSRGFAYYPDWTEEGFSYGQEWGVATFSIFGQKLNVFDLTSAGGASAANMTAVGSVVAYSSAATPTA